MLGISYTRSGLFCEDLSSQNVEGGYALFESLPDDRASRDTNLQFSFVVPQVKIFRYFVILNYGLGRYLRPKKLKSLRKDHFSS